MAVNAPWQPHATDVSEHGVWGRVGRAPLRRAQVVVTDTIVSVVSGSGAAGMPAVPRLLFSSRPALPTLARLDENTVGETGSCFRVLPAGL